MDKANRADVGADHWRLATTAFLGAEGPDPFTGTWDQAWYVLRLATGTAAECTARQDWEAIYRLAWNERCAALAWHRSGDLIRQAAPVEVVERWRGTAVWLDGLARRQLREIHEVLRWLAAHGVAALSLKGPVLSKLLYDQIGLRRSADLDIYVPAGQRKLADDALRAGGWYRGEGVAPFDANYVKGSGNNAVVIDAHSFLWGEWFAHVPAADVAQSVVDIDDLRIAFLRDDFVPAYLASNIISGTRQSLLQFIDFATHWATRDASARKAARGVASASRLSGVLEWAVQQSALLENAVRGDVSAFTDLVQQGRANTSEDGIRLMLRHSTLADRLPVLGNVIWPRNRRGSWRDFMRLSLSRVQKRLRTAVAVS